MTIQSYFAKSIRISLADFCCTVCWLHIFLMRFTGGVSSAISCKMLSFYALFIYEMLIVSGNRVTKTKKKKSILASICYLWWIYIVQPKRFFLWVHVNSKQTFKESETKTWWDGLVCLRDLVAYSDYVVWFVLQLLQIKNRCRRQIMQILILM